MRAVASCSRVIISRLFGVAAIGLGGSVAAGGQAPATLIINAQVLDGTGAPARAVAVRILDERIASVGTFPRNQADRVIDAKGLTLAPAFIDTHSHHDRGLFTQRDALGAVSQGITTIVVGQDGGSRFPLAELFARLDTQRVAINVAAEFKGRYISHVRSEDREFWQALDELIAIGRTHKMPVQVSHLKLAMRGLWGQGDELIATLNKARADGVNVTADVDPYTMCQAGLTVLYPKRNFTDRAEIEFILKEVASPEDLVMGYYRQVVSGKSGASIDALTRAPNPGKYDEIA